MCRDGYVLRDYGGMVTSYPHFPAAFEPYDPRAAQVAEMVREMIRGVEPRLEAEHFGSTAVPGCPAKA